MGGCPTDDECYPDFAKEVLLTLVLVGRTGNGKSATGNSILGRTGFKSEASFGGVTSTCALQQTVLKNGQILNVIDTPGFFDPSMDSGSVGKEIAKCINMAKDGIHAVVVVLSARNRFSEEEEAAINSLRTLFGNKINDYMFIAFTGGDDLEKKGQNLKNLLGNNCPKPLKDILCLCEYRCVLFDNNTTDSNKKDEQVQKLLSLVNRVNAINKGKPFTDEIFVELKKGTMELPDYTEKVNSSEGCSKEEISEELLTRITAMVELKLKEATSRLEKQLAKEHAARLKAEKESNDEIRKLRESLEEAQNELRKHKQEKAQKERDEQNKQAQSSTCQIL